MHYTTPSASILETILQKRRVALLLMAVLLLLSLIATQSRPEATKADYNHIWHDDFNSMDLGRWQEVNGPAAINNEMQAYHQDWVGTTTFDGQSALYIRANTTDNYGKSYTSGEVWAKNGYIVAGQRVEFRAWLPSGQGVWPALWLVNTPCDGINGCGGNWPPEIDVMEMKGNDPYTIYQTHWWGTWPGQGYNTSTFNNGTNFAGGWHTYAVDWQGDMIRFYVDHKLTSTRTANITPGMMKIVMNVAVGGDFLPAPGNTNPSGVTDAGVYMYVDYVRVSSINNGFSIESNLWYTISNEGNGKCVDAAGNGNTAQLHQYTCHKGDNQQWQFIPTDSGYYRVVPRHATGIGWDVEQVSTANGAKIHHWNYVGGGNQQWKPEAQGRGVYIFRARHSNKCLDVPNGSPNNSVQLQQWDCNGGHPNMRFNVIQVP